MTNLVNMAQGQNALHVQAGLSHRPLSKESNYHTGSFEQGILHVPDLNLKLLDDCRQTNKILMMALGQDISEIERIGGVKPLENPNDLLSYLQSKGLLNQNEISQLKNVYSSVAGKNYAGQSGYVSQTGLPASDAQAAKFGSGPSALGGASVQGYPQGYQSGAGYYSQPHRDGFSTPSKTIGQQPYSASLNLASFQDRLSQPVAAAIRACEVIVSPRFIEGLERFAKSRSKVVDEAAFTDYARQSGFDLATVNLCESLSSAQILRSQKQQVEGLSQMLENQRKHYISLLENTVKVHPKTTYLLNKLSPELRFDGHNLDNILESIEKKLESFQVSAGQYSKRVESLEKSLIESNLKITQETETANRIINEVRSKEMKIQELVASVRKLCGIAQQPLSDDFTQEIYALENINVELKRAKQGLNQFNYGSGVEAELASLRKQLADSQKAAGEHHTHLVQAMNKYKDYDSLKLQLDNLSKDNSSLRHSLIESKDQLSKAIDEQRDSKASASIAQQQDHAEKDILAQRLQTLSTENEKLRDENSSLRTEVDSLWIAAKKSKTFFEDTCADHNRKLQESENKASTALQQLAATQQGLKELQDFKASVAPSLQRLSEIEAYLPTVQAREQQLHAGYLQLQTREQGLAQTEQSLKTKDQELAAKAKQLEDYRLQLENFNSENLKRKSEIDAKASEWDKVIQEAEKKGQDAEAKIREFERLRDQSDTSTNQLVQITTERDSLLTSNKNLERDLQSVTGERDQLKTEIESLKNERTALLNEHKVAVNAILNEKQLYSDLESQFKNLQEAYNSLYQNFNTVCEQANKSKQEGDALVSRVNELNVENGKLKELITMLETQTSKMEATHQEENQLFNAAINQLRQQVSEAEAVKAQRDNLLKDVANLTTEISNAKNIIEHQEEVIAKPSHISKPNPDQETEVESLRDENNKLREDLESLIEEVKGFQSILDENEKLKENVNSLQQDNELMAQALEEINDKIEKRQIIIVDQPEDEDETADGHTEGHNGQVRIDDEDEEAHVNRQVGEEEEGVALDQLDHAQLLKYTTEELANLKDSYDQLKESYEQNLEQMEVLRRENDELREDLIKIVGAQEGGLEEEGQEERVQEVGEEEAMGEGEQDERTNEEIIDENEQLIELLRELSQQIGALKEAYVEVINALFTKNEEREAKGLNYAEFVTSAEEMQEQVKNSQHERGIDNMRDFNKGLRESVEFYESEKNRMIARIQKIEAWCREDEQGLVEGTERGQEEGVEEGVEEQGQDNIAEEGQEEGQAQEADEELSVDKLVELLLITLQLIEKIRETANAEEASELERLEAIVDSINKFEQMGDSGEGNFELATILQKIVDNKANQEGVEEYAQEEQQVEDQGQEEMGQEEARVRTTLL